MIFNCRSKGSSSRNASSSPRQSGKLCTKFITVLAKGFNIFHGFDTTNSNSVDASSRARNAKYSIAAADRTEFSTSTARA